MNAHSLETPPPETAAANRQLDVIYVTASARDARLTRICVASIRHFYPDAPIRLLVGGALERGLEEELARYWNVQRAPIPVGDWGWGFVKLEPLFGPAGERFLVVDSDTVFTGRVLETWACSQADFLVDDEQQTVADTHRLYYDWQTVATIDPAARPPRFLFNSGQWFGTSGVLRREDFDPFIDWSRMPPKHRQADIFMPGDQGVLNYVMNQKMQLYGISVAQQKIMQWPGFGLDGICVEKVRTGQSPPLIIHWAGYKGGRLSNFPGSDLLRYFESRYYELLPFGAALRSLRRVKYPLQYLYFKVADMVTYRLTGSRTT